MGQLLNQLIAGEQAKRRDREQRQFMLDQQATGQDRLTQGLLGAFGPQPEPFMGTPLLNPDPFIGNTAETFPGESLPPGLQSLGAPAIPGFGQPQADTLANLLTAPGGAPAASQVFNQMFPQPAATDKKVVDVRVGKGPNGEPIFEQRIVDLNAPDSAIPLGVEGSKAPQTLIQNTPTPPPNFRFKDTNSPMLGVEPIPGSTADPKSPLFAANRERQKQFDKSAQTVFRTQDSLNRYKALINKHGARSMDIRTRKKITAAYTDLLLEMKELANLGVLAGPDLDLMEAVLTNPSGIEGAFFETIGGREVFSGQLNLVDEKLNAARQQAVDLFGGEGVRIPKGFERKPQQPAKSSAQSPGVIKALEAINKGVFDINLDGFDEKELEQIDAEIEKRLKATRNGRQ